MTSALLPFAALLALAVPAGAGPEMDAATPVAAPGPFAGNMTGDWGGLRTKLADHGISFTLESTHFYQSLVSGDGDHGGDYGGRLDGFLTLDTGKMGLWEGGQLVAHAEYFYEDLPPNLGGTLLPNNLGMKLPQNSEGDVIVSSLYLAQQLGERASLRIGKINTVDLIANDLFFGGWGISRFQNLAFAAPPNGLLPPVMMGAILSYRTDPLTWTLMLYDANDRTREFVPDGFLDDGFNTSLGVTWGGKWAGRTTTAALTGIYSTKDNANLGEVLLPETLRTGTKDDSWHASFQFSHLLCEPEPGTGWGIFVKAGLSDGNPNPYQNWITGGIGGNGLLASRPQDRWGVGYFYYGLSDDLRNALGAVVKVDNEQGAEAYYSYAVTPWFHLTGDLQVVNPATGANGTAVVGGLRARVVF